MTPCHPDDKKWVNQQISMLPLQYRQTAIEGYSKTYGHPKNLFEEAERRREANTRLREYVERVSKKMARSYEAATGQKRQ